MPGNTPVLIGSAAVNAGTNITAQPIVTSVAVAAGDAIIVDFNTFVGAGAFSSVTGGTDTYVAVASAKTAGSFVTGIAYVLSSAGLASGSTINVNISAGPGQNYLTARVYKIVGGLLAADVSATATQGATTAASVGPTAATGQAIELAMAAFGTYIASATALGFTAGGAYTALTPSVATGASDANGLFPEYLVTAATGAQTATGTVTGGTPSSMGGVVVAFTYPGGAGGGRIPSIPSLASLPAVA